MKGSGEVPVGKAEYKFYDEKMGKYKKGDLILVPFGDRVPSVYRVENARGKKLIVTVLEDNYEKSRVEPGSMRDFSKVIYEGWWCHRRIPKTQPRATKKIRQEKP